MLPLVVHIERSSGGPVITRAFHESPVRIGRSPFASLRLREPFVSEWQAVVRFHGDRTTYLDLGSRNPTNIDGKPVERNVEVELSAKTDVRIGTLRLRFERIAAPREDPDEQVDGDTAFAPEQLLGKERLAGTIILKELPEARGFGSPPPPPPRRPSGAVSQDAGVPGRPGTPPPLRPSGPIGSPPAQRPSAPIGSPLPQRPSGPIAHAPNSPNADAGAPLRPSGPIANAPGFANNASPPPLRPSGPIAHAPGFANNPAPQRPSGPYAHAPNFANANPAVAQPPDAQQSSERPAQAPQRPSGPNPQPAYPSSLAMAERMLDDARSVYLEAVKNEIDQAALPQRAQRVRELAAQSGKLVDEPAFRNWARANGVEPLELGYVDVGNWLARLCGSAGTTPKPEHLALTMERAGQLLELFASAFIDSRRAHQRARQKLGLSQVLESKSTLVSTEDPHALLAHLLEPGQAVQARSQELRRMLGDFAMHQIALLSAVVEGARAMLTQLSPRAIENVPDANIDSGVLDNEPTAAGWGFAARKLWRKYLVRHHDLTHTDHFARELFGREFTRRYHAIADSASHVERPERT